MSDEEANNVNPQGTGLGEVHLQTIKVETNSVTKKRKKYIKYTPKDTF